jgi:uncharacterized membrane-anchored protein YhcB (DUF1043 family)
MVFLIGLIGLLVGVLGGGALCVRYLRQEIAADIGPGLKRVQMQLDNLQTEINLALATRLADLCKAQTHVVPPPGDGRDGPRAWRESP